jgi:hypothetical protein
MRFPEQRNRILFVRFFADEHAEIASGERRDIPKL